MPAREWPGCGRFRRPSIAGPAVLKRAAGTANLAVI
jgi:hypothetical protein